MSDVFISYARSSEKQAEQIADALRALGYNIWRDDEVPPHRAYTEVIEERLRLAKAVVVIWSAEAVKSEWVQSEADRARADRKLVQLRIDDAALPMPFERIQCADLANWTGDADAPGWRRVLTSIAELVGPSGPSADVSAGSHATSGVAERRPATRGRRWAWAVLAAATLLLLAGGAWLLRDRLTPSAGGPLRIAVLPFDTQSAGQDVRFFADSLHDEISGGLSDSQIAPVSREASAELRGPGARDAVRRIGARLILDGAARSDGQTMHVRVHLDDPEAQVTLWSREFEAPVKDATLLQARVAHRMVVVLDCSRDALQPEGGLKDLSLLSRYLHACDIFADWDVHQGYDPQRYAEWTGILRVLTQQAPEFAPAQYTYATAAAVSAKGVSPLAAAALRQEAVDHMNRGATMLPAAPDPFEIRAQLVPASHWGEREGFLRQGLAAAPSSAQANIWLGAMLVETGRVREGVEFAQRASAGEMVYDWGIFSSALACVDAGNERAQADIEHFQQLVPESLFAEDAQLFCLENAGKWGQAQSLLAAIPDVPTPFRGKAAAAFYRAAASRSPADVATARQLALTSASQSPLFATRAISWLSELGFVDDAFALADHYDPDAAPELNPNIFMFAETTRNLRRDPRFMRLAARIGLVNYWRSSGHWPDFCSEPGLPYDCKVEAAKLAGGHA